MTNHDIELMKKDMEEEILSQIQANQQVLQGSKTSWDLKVILNYKSYYSIIIIMLKKRHLFRQGH